MCEGVVSFRIMLVAVQCERGDDSFEVVLVAVQNFLYTRARHGVNGSEINRNLSLFWNVLSVVENK